MIAQQVMMSPFDFGPGLVWAGAIPPGTPPVWNMDAWDGYVAERNRILGFLAEEGVRNAIVLTGDIHSSWVADLKADFDKPDSPVVATEFVGTSISSDFPAAFIPLIQASVPANAQIRYFNGALRGYVPCEVDRRRWRTDFRLVSSILDPEAPVSTAASFVVEDGVPGAEPA